MALTNQPYIPFYIHDFLLDEKLINCSAESTGVYIRLICILHMMENYGEMTLKAKEKQNDSNIVNFAIKLSRSMPYTEDVIERSLAELVEEDVIQLEGDKLSQKRMVRDGEISEARAKAGRKGGKAPKSHTYEAQIEEESKEGKQAKKQSELQTEKQNGSEDESKTEAKQEQNPEYEIEYEYEDEVEVEREDKGAIGGEGERKEEKRSPTQERWEQFWKAYPRKSGKGAAEKSFKKLAPDQALFELIMQQLEQAKASKQWLRDDGDFIPYPATWLNQKRWGDEYAPARGHPKPDDKPWDWNEDSPFAEWSDGGDG